ncbi:hypothetical protein [Kocuria rosea]|uniref:hypothetical protein n=1 Tax=Kocuria rosea TaxID=1275 RepID=UPI00203B40B3|nr:hypothetical protein [Kocuria rosea]MCM3687107.1 hypothetical protein [Kocuria rosea]
MPAPAGAFPRPSLPLVPTEDLVLRTDHARARATDRTADLPRGGSLLRPVR